MGVNAYRAEEVEAVPLLRLDAAQEGERAQALADFRAKRDRSAAEASLDRLRAAAEGGSNLMPPTVEAVEAAATLGEISDALRDVFGTHE